MENRVRRITSCADDDNQDGDSYRRFAECGRKEDTAVTDQLFEYDPLTRGSARAGILPSIKPFLYFFLSSNTAFSRLFIDRFIGNDFYLI